MIITPPAPQICGSFFIVHLTRAAATSAKIREIKKAPVEEISTGAL